MYMYSDTCCIIHVHHPQKIFQDLVTSLQLSPSLLRKHLPAVPLDHSNQPQNFSVAIHATATLLWQRRQDWLAGFKKHPILEDYHPHCLEDYCPLVSFFSRNPNDNDQEKRKKQIVRSITQGPQEHARIPENFTEDLLLPLG